MNQDQSDEGGFTSEFIRDDDIKTWFAFPRLLGLLIDLWNPWDAQVQRIPGGSSSGSGVSVAADLVPAALGTDTGGSVRLPAAFNGLVGLKPTFGRVSTVGIEPLNLDLDSPGPIVRSVEDAALFLQALAGPDPADENTWNRPCEQFAENLDVDLSGMRVCFPHEYFWEETEDEVEAAVRASAHVFADLDVQVDEISIPEINEMAASFFGRANMSAVELFMRLRDHLAEQPEVFDPAVGPRIMTGKDVSAVDYLEIKKVLPLEHGPRKSLRDNAPKVYLDALQYSQLSGPGGRGPRRRPRDFDDLLERHFLVVPVACRPSRLPCSESS